MNSVASLLPSDREQPSDDRFPLRLRSRLRDRFGVALLDLRIRCTALAALALGPWTLLLTIAAHWQLHTEAWPSQETLARLTATNARSIRRYSATLALRGLVRLRRERRANGAERIYYAPGPVLLQALEAFAGRYPAADRSPRPAVALPAGEGADLVLLGAAAPEPTSTHPPDTASSPPPDTVSGELLFKEIEPSFYEPANEKLDELQEEEISAPSGGENEEGDDAPLPSPASNAVPAPAPTPTLASTPSPAADDIEIAREALAERMKRKFPDRKPPCWFDRAELELVARCTSTLEGDHDAKLAAHRAAIGGAFEISKGRAPTVRFIWERYEHFIDHMERTRAAERAKALAAERAKRVAPLAKTRAPEPKVVLSAEETRANAEALLAALTGGGTR